MTVKPDSLGSATVLFLIRLTTGLDGSYLGDGLSGVQLKDMKVEVSGVTAAVPQSQLASAFSAVVSILSAIGAFFTQ